MTTDITTLEAPQVVDAIAVTSDRDNLHADLQALHVQTLTAAAEAIDTAITLAAVADVTPTVTPVIEVSGTTFSYDTLAVSLQEVVDHVDGTKAIPVVATIITNDVETDPLTMSQIGLTEHAVGAVSVTELDPSNLKGTGTVTPLSLTKKQKRAQQVQQAVAQPQGELSAEDKLNALAGKFGKKLINKSDQPAVLRQGPKQTQRPRPAPAPVEIPEARRQVASLLTAFIQTQKVTGLNNEEGVDHINIGVSATAIGRALDPYSRQKNRSSEWVNFIHNQLGEFACIASMIFFLKSPEGEDRNSWRTQWSQPLRKRSEKGEFNAVKGLKLFVADAYWQLVQQNTWMMEQLDKSDLPLTMYFYFGKESVRRQAREASWLIPIIDSIRTAVKAKAEYPDFSFIDVNEAI
jgi:hypothetical protein